MKWVGRVLLVLLIASTLFVAKQNDFSPVAEAQTNQIEIQSCENILIELNRVEPSNIVEIVRCQRETNLFGDTWNALVEFSPYISTPTGPWPYPPEIWENNACASNRNIGPSHDYENCFTDTPNRFGKIGQIKNFLTFGCPTVAGGSLPMLGAWECHTRQEPLGNDSSRIFLQTHLVFTIPTCGGGTGGQGFLIERAHAQTCKIDLRPDITTMRVSVDNRDMAKALVSEDTQSIIVSGLKIKNLGNGASSSNTPVSIRFVNSENSNFHLDGPTIRIPSISGYGSYSLGPINITGNWNQLKNELLPGLAERHYNTLDLEVKVYDEKDENSSNNSVTTSDFFSWPLAIVTVLDMSRENQDVHYAIVNATLGTRKFTEITNSGSNARAYFVPLANPSPNTDYLFSVDYEGETGLSPTHLIVSGYQIFELTIRISPQKGVIVAPEPLVPSEFDKDPTKFDSFFGGNVSGKVTAVVRGKEGSLLTQNLTHNVAKFSGLTSGDVLHVTSINAVVSFDIGNAIKNEKVSYQWTDKDGSVDITYEGSTTTNKVPIKLQSDCSTVSKNGLVKICVYEDPEHLALAKTSYLPRFKAVIDRATTQFVSTARLTKVSEVWALPYVSGLSSYSNYLGGAPFIFVTGRYAAVDSTFADTLLMREVMIALDDQMKVTGFEPFWQSVHTSFEIPLSPPLTESTARWAWQNLGWTCAYVPSALKPKCLGMGDPLGTDPTRGGSGAVANSNIIWSEQMTALCVFPTEVNRRFVNFSTIWQQNPLRDGHGNPLPIPGDLAKHSKIMSSRSTGDRGIKRGNVIYDVSGHYTMVPGVLSVANSCDPAAGINTIP